MKKEIKIKIRKDKKKIIIILKIKKRYNNLKIRLKN